MKTDPVISVVASLMLCACATVPHAAPEASSLPGAYLAANPLDAGEGAFWPRFGDPLLLRMLERADHANGDLAVATARLAAVRAAARGSRAEGLPEVAGRLATTRRENSLVAGIPTSGRSGNLYEAGFDVGWEWDLFGRLAAETAAAERDVQAAVLDLQALRVTIAAETARLYLAVRTLQSRLVVLHDAAQAQADLAGLAQSRASAGLASQAEALRAEGFEASTRAQEAVLRGQLAESLAGLALIQGLTASALAPELEAAATMVDVPSPLLGAPEDLLLRRPDVRRDFARLAAADGRSAARARDRLPRLTVNLSAGSSAAAAGMLFTPAAQVFALGAALAGPVFDFGRRQAISDQAAALADERAAALETTVLTAIREVERDAAAVQARREELCARTLEVERTRTVRRLLERRYAAGLQGFSDVLDAERSALAGEDSERVARQAYGEAVLSLWKSLGGTDGAARPDPS